MEKKQKSSHLLIVALSLILLTGCLLLIPFLTTSVFSFQRERLFHDFQTTLQSEQALNPQAFWKFREFYSPGSFEFQRQGFLPTKQQQILTSFDIPLNLSSASAFLVYSSPHLRSVDLLTPQSQLESLIQSSSSDTTLIYQDKVTRLMESEKYYTLLFIKPLSELRKAMGYFDFDNQDKGMLEGKHWLNVTIIEK